MVVNGYLDDLALKFSLGVKKRQDKLVLVTAQNTL